MTEVPRTPTPVTDTELAPLLVQGLTERIGATPYQNVALLFFALIWTENGRGAAVIGNNIGNLAAAGYVNGVEHFTWSGDYWRPQWYSNPADPQHAQMLEGQIPSAFRVYPTLAAGLGGFLDLLFRPLYEPVLVAAGSGDPIAFAHSLSAHWNPDPRYDPVATGRTFGYLVQEFLTKGLFDSLPKGVPAPPAPSPPSPSVWALSPSDVILPVIGGNLRLYELRKGEQGALVAVWQKLLGLTVTSIFDEPTDTGTRAWQTKQGLVDDGIVGFHSWSRVLG